MITRTRTAAAALTLATLALTSCGSSNTDASAPAPSSTSAPASSATASPTPSLEPTYDNPSPNEPTGTALAATPPAEDFTLADTVTFASTDGTTGTINFNQAPPQDLQEALETAGYGGGTWARMEVNNQQGTDELKSFTVTAVDAAGHKYEMHDDGDWMAKLYGDADSSDPNQDWYFDLWEKYDSDPGYIVPGEVRPGIVLYSEDPMPEALVRADITGLGMSGNTPLVKQ